MAKNKSQLPPPEVVEVIRKVLELLGTVKGKLPQQAMDAMGILASVIGYGKKLKETLNDQELRVVMDQLARVEHELDEDDLVASSLPGDLVQSIKALVRGLILVLRQAGEPYAYPAYKPPSGIGQPTYYYPVASIPTASVPTASIPTVPIPKRAAPGTSAAKPKAKARESNIVPIAKLVESACLTEAVEGAEGLEWQIVLIEAGLSKNRKLYSSQTLENAIPLFEGLSSYADHPSRTQMANGIERSIRDLAGWVTNVRFDGNAGTQEQGAVVGIYHALASGPIASLLREAWSRDKPDLVQFSILGDGRQKMARSENGQLYFNVESIERLFSLDAVPQGAAGGRVQALIASVQEEVNDLKLLEEMTLDQLATLRPDLAGEIVTDQALAPSAQSAPPPAKNTPAVEGPALGALTEEVRRMQMELALANRQRMLVERVATSPLPDPVKARLRDDFAGVVFDEATLDAAIERETSIWTSILREKPMVLTQSDTKCDRYSDALYGLLVGEDVNGVSRFHSLHQAYCAVKGLPFDTPRTAIADGLVREGVGFDPGSLLMESPSISWTLVFGTALQRKLIKDYQIPAFDEWRSVVSEIGDLDDFKEQKIERVGYYGILPTVGKGATYQPLTSPGEEEAKYSPLKKGGLEDWTWEDALNDDLGALKKIPKRLALSAKITLYQYVFNFLRDGNATATSYDSVNLFHATHGNMGTAALSSASLTAAKIAMRSQSALGSAVTFLAVRPKTLVVPNELEALAIQLRNSDYEVPAVGTATSTQVANPHKGTFDIVVVDYFTDAARWFLAADTGLVPTIEVGFLGGKSEPELLTMAENVGSGFTADKIVFKARFVFGAAPLDHRGLYASDPDW